MSNRDIVYSVPFAGKTDMDNGDKWLPLWVHLRDTGEMMLRLWEGYLPPAARELLCSDCCEPVMKQLCRFIGLVHDIGKLTSGFQAMILRSLPEMRSALETAGYEIPMNADRTPHALASEVILLDLGCPEGIADIVGAHHGKPQPGDVTQRIPDAKYHGGKKGKWRSLWESFYTYALGICGLEADDLPELSVGQQLILSGLLIMADWIASNRSFFPLLSVGKMGSEDMYPQRADEAWNALELPEGGVPKNGGMDADEFAHRFGFAPNTVQKMMTEAADSMSEPGIIILEAQMGVGKTEAALAAAEVLADKFGCSGMFFGLPTQATANGIFPRLIDWAKNQPDTFELSVRLAHGMAELNEDYRRLSECRDSEISDDGDTELVVHSWFNGRKLALLSNFVIGTIDQLLVAALKQKHVMLRHLGLVGKVVIIDEVHAYDAYMNRYLSMALRWLGVYRVPVIVLSATLPEIRRTELVTAYLNKHRMPRDEKWQSTRAYPLLTWTDGVKICQTSCVSGSAGRKVSIHMTTDAGRVAILSEKLRDGGCACVITNTVKRAQKLADEPLGQCLFSSRSA